MLHAVGIIKFADLMYDNAPSFYQSYNGIQIVSQYRIYQQVIVHIFIYIYIYISHYFPHFPMSELSILTGKSFARCIYHLLFCVHCVSQSGQNVK